MSTLSLRISIPEKNVTKTMQFDPSTSVYDACRIIREKLAEASNMGQPKDYGLFLADEDVKKGVWLEPGRNLDYYILRNGDLLEYRRKLRTLRVRMLDGTLKTMLVDDSQPVANLMVVICTKIGITNHDEYSLVRELADEETENQKPGNFGTLTLKRRKEDKGERDAKMDQLRKKLKTDDEVNWIDPSKTLREQGIDESETVLLRRKFFFSDQNIDSRDPVQLSLLYVQARDAILDGTHPVTEEKACIFAGIQCQIQFGDHKEDKHKPGFLDLKEFLPQSYLKMKGIEKKVFAEHKKHIGLSELDSKVLYTKTARSLSTYGVTFFLVKEKMKGKNKLVPRLLGVTKDSVLRLDERTKEILKTWPLTTVRRWGASPNTFTLDFGDYSDQYYSVQTTEAEQILQLISGYIDIILKKQKAKDHFGIEGDEGSTMVEDSVSPLKATIMQHETSNVGKGNVEAVSVAIPAVMRVGGDGARPYGTGHMGGAQYTTVSGQVNIAHASPMVQQTKVTSVLSEPQRALLSTITAGHEVIHVAETELYCKAQLPELGNDPASLKWIEQTIDTHKQSVGSHIAAMNAATAQVVTLTSGPADDVDHSAVGAAITTIATNLPEMTKGVRMIAALMDDESSGDKLLDAARKLCSAFSDLLKATEPETKEPRQSLLNAASRVGEASHQVLSTIGEEDDSNRELQDMLLALAKAVANSTAALVLKAKNIAATCEDSVTQNRVISAATQCALATSQLVACAKVVAPTLHSSACQTQLMNAVREVTKAVEGLLEVCNDTCSDENLLRELNTAASEVSRTLNDLLNHIKTATRAERAKESFQEGAVETILVATDKLFASTGDAGEMVRQARVAGQATAQLIQSIKGEAERLTDSEQQRRLLAAAKVLVDATAKMIEAARQCVSHPHDAKMQDQLRLAAEELRAGTTAAATPALRRKFINRLEVYTDVSAGTSVQEFGRDSVDVVRATETRHTSPGDVADAYAQREVAEHSKMVTEKVSQVLRGTQACINAASTVSGIIGDLDTTILFATAGTLHAENEGDTFADHRENILKTAKALVEDTKTLVAGAASSQEQLAVAAQNAVSTIVQLAEVVKYGAASLGSQNPEAQVMLINAVKDVASALGDLIHATKAASGKPINDPSMAHLKDSAKVMVTNVTSLLKTVKAVEDEHTRGTRALESTIEALAQEIRALNISEIQKSNVTPEDLVRCTKSITTSTAKAVAAGNSCKQDDIIAAANMGRKAISDMLIICKGAAYNCAETAELRDRTLQTGHDVAINYRELLQAILQISSRSGDAKHTLPPISRKIAQSVTELVAVAELLKGTDWVDPDDPTVIAENELLGAAASIDAAAKKLASLRPRRSIQEASEDMNFDEMILEAAKSIAAATSALIKAASAAQRELIATGKVSRTPLTSSDDGQWSEGLISAARMVAAATHSLVESANALVQGVSSEEKLISSAKQVASSTAQLLVACKVKADPDSESTKRLQAAGNAVKRATDNLVRAAQQAIQQEEDRSLILNRRMVGGIAQEINARSEVLRIERELEEARGRLTAIRQAKYKNRPDLADTDNEADQSGYESYTTSSDQVHSTRQISQIAADKQNLVSPEKVHSTQNTLERKMRDNQYRSAMESQYGSVVKKYSDNEYDTRYGLDSPYVICEKKVLDSSPGQYSSIERKINQESYSTAEKKQMNGPYPPVHTMTFSPASSTRKVFQEQEEQQQSWESKEYATSGNELSTFKALDNNTVEERLMKKSMTQKITEKKTVTMTTSTKQESNTKTFRFEEK